MLEGKSPVHHQQVGTVIGVIRHQQYVPLQRNLSTILCVKLMSAATVNSPSFTWHRGTIVSCWGKWNPWLGVKDLSGNRHLALQCAVLCHLLPSSPLPSPADAKLLPGWEIMHTPPQGSAYSPHLPAWFGWSNCLRILPSVKSL